MTPTGQVFVPTVTNEPDGDFEKENALTLSTHWKEEWHTQLDLSLITLQPGSVNFAPRKSDLSSKTFVLAELFFFFESLGLCVRRCCAPQTPRRGQRSKNVFITKRKQPIEKVAAPATQLSVDVDLSRPTRGCFLVRPVLTSERRLAAAPGFLSGAQQEDGWVGSRFAIIAAASLFISLGNRGSISTGVH